MHHIRIPIDMDAQMDAMEISVCVERDGTDVPWLCCGFLGVEVSLVMLFGGLVYSYKYLMCSVGVI